MVQQSFSIVQNIVVNYYLVVSYPQLCHIAINVNIIEVIVITTYIMFPFPFSRAEI